MLTLETARTFFYRHGATNIGQIYLLITNLIIFHFSLVYLGGVKNLQGLANLRGLPQDLNRNNTP
ncbi:MAG: hypothetical protein DRR08_23045 [Candidatus Parabeggiatoa sp. nov. 2]|nr:MAG: hypothetical protein DRR08_23045 [Gammaproteobacteria bacterium]